MKALPPWSRSKGVVLVEAPLKTTTGEKTMIRFELDTAWNKLTFDDVEVDGFFIDVAGNLCMKCSDDSCFSIADPHGDPIAGYFNNIEYSCSIQKILPKVAKIHFE